MNKLPSITDTDPTSRKGLFQLVGRSGEIAYHWILSDAIRLQSDRITHAFPREVFIARRDEGSDLNPRDHHLDSMVYGLTELKCPQSNARITTVLGLCIEQDPFVAAALDNLQDCDFGKKGHKTADISALSSADNLSEGSESFRDAVVWAAAVGYKDDSRQAEPTPIEGANPAILRHYAYKIGKIGAFSALRETPVKDFVPVS